MESSILPFLKPLNLLFQLLNMPSTTHTIAEAFIIQVIALRYSQLELISWTVLNGCTFKVAYKHNLSSASLCYSVLRLRFLENSFLAPEALALCEHHDCHIRLKANFQC